MGNRITSSLSALTECIAPQLAAVDEMFRRDQNTVDQERVFLRHVQILPRGLIVDREA